MLVLSRKSGERIVIEIGGEMVRFSMQIEGGRARLLFEAPDEVAIYREEVYLSMKGEKNGNGVKQTAIDAQPARGV